MRDMIDILYDDNPILVVAKPAGLPTQAPPAIESLESRIKQSFAAAGEAGPFYLAILHRLDRPASGALLFCRKKKVARKLSKQFERRQIRKVYWACVEGEVTPEAGTWRDQLIKVPDEARAEVVAADHPNGRHAVLHYRVVGRTPFGSWLEIELETGRTHQIRIQAASRGWPVQGDAQYGATHSFGPQLEDPRKRAIALHARQLGFENPLSKQSVLVTAPVSDAWHDLGVVPTGATHGLV